MCGLASITRHFALVFLEREEIKLSFFLVRSPLAGLDTNTRLYLMGSTLWLIKAVGLEKTHDAGILDSGVEKVGNVSSVPSVEVPWLGVGGLACCRLSSVSFMW